MSIWSQGKFCFKLQDCCGSFAWPSDHSFIGPWCRERLSIKALYISISMSSASPQSLPFKPFFLPIPSYEFRPHRNILHSPPLNAIAHHVHPSLLYSHVSILGIFFSFLTASHCMTNHLLKSHSLLLHPEETIPSLPPSPSSLTYQYHDLHNPPFFIPYIATCERQNLSKPPSIRPSVRPSHLQC